MSDVPPLRPFVIEALTDLGARVSDGDSLVWVQAPESVQRDLEVPARFALSFDPERSGEFEAEMVAPGSYFLERLVSVVTRRGQWDVSRCAVTATDWISDALHESGLDPETAVSSRVDGIEDELLLLFAFRVTLVSDEKRESFHLVAVSLVDGSTWPEDPDRADRGLVRHPAPAIRPDLEAAYRLATESLRTTTGVEVERFRTRSLGLLEEEVRRIFGYFDRTIDGLRESDPGGSQDLLRAVMAERDRRLTEAVERFDPKASASLCSIRAILVPTARLHLEFPDGTRTESRLDAWSRRLRGLACKTCGGAEGPWRPSRDGLRCARCAATQAESARPRGRPRSDTPRRGTRAGEASARASRGSTARSRGASSGRPRP